MTMEKNDILKALIKQSPGENIEYYEDILSQVDQTVSYPDIFSETVAKVFQLVITGKIDPWSVNINEFKNMFTVERNENFEVAGILISSAWHVLYEKSMKIVDKGTDNNQILGEEQNGIEYSGYDDTTMDPGPELNMPVYHQESARVTLAELLKAMKHVYKSREKKEFIESETEDSIDINEDIIAKSNIDTIEEGIKQAMQKIMNLMNPFFVEDYWGSTKKEKTSFILYLLFIEKAGKIAMEQDTINGNISVTKFF
ncbi:MAG: hypothetical protein QXZ44_04005 [Ferroplasma sp.]